MPLYKFNQNDIFINQIESEVKQEFFIYDGKVYYNGKRPQSGSFTDSVAAPVGTLSLFEENIDRSVSRTGLITPYVVKNNSLVAFRDISDQDFSARYAYGQQITGTYPITSSLVRQFFAANSARPRITALKNTLNYYKTKNPFYAFSSSNGNKATQEINLISVPNIFYGSKITKGSVSLKYYITGTLIGELADVYKNGSLVQIGPSGSSGSGSVAGVVLYDEGFVLLTGSWDLAGYALDYPDASPSADQPKWIYFGTSLFDGTSVGAEVSSSYSIDFSGTNFVPNIMMLCSAPAGQLDHSNNPTFLEHGQTFNSLASVSTRDFREQEFNIKNIITSSYVEQTASYEKQVFISKIGIYDKDQNLIGVAKLAKPVKKTLDRDFTFKLKMDF